MGNIKKFSEQSEVEPKKVMVKHIIEYLSSLNPEMVVNLDHDGWGYNGIDGEVNMVDIVANRGLFEVWTFDGVEIMTINN